MCCCCCLFKGGTGFALGLYAALLLGCNPLGLTGLPRRQWPEVPAGWRQSSPSVPAEAAAVFPLRGCGLAPCCGMLVVFPLCRCVMNTELTAAPESGSLTLHLFHARRKWKGVKEGSVFLQRAERAYCLLCVKMNFLFCRGKEKKTTTTTKQFVDEECAGCVPVVFLSHSGRGL